MPSEGLGSVFCVWSGSVGTGDRLRFSLRYKKSKFLVKCLFSPQLSYIFPINGK